MAERNRVLPTGEIVAVPLRGAWTGNRGGVLHRGHEIVRAYASKAWITCALEFRGRRMAQWEEGHYTPLFFADEAVALAAGHRPCAFCRRADFRRFQDAFAQGNGLTDLRAAGTDAVLHDERRRAPAVLAWRDLPDGTFVRLEEGPALVLGDRLVPWTVTGYGAAVARPTSGEVTALTPPSTVRALTAGYRPQTGA
jgi:hypothetical protein